MKNGDLTKAPGTSHVESFGLVPGESPKRGWLVEVNFRRQGSQPRSTYHYQVGSEREATSIFRELSQAESPGKVVHRRLKGRFPFWKVR